VKGHYTDKAPESALYRQSGYAGVNITVLSTCVSLRMLLVYFLGISSTFVVYHSHILAPGLSAQRLHQLLPVP